MGTNVFVADGCVEYLAWANQRHICSKFPPDPLLLLIGRVSKAKLFWHFFFISNTIAPPYTNGIIPEAGQVCSAAKAKTTVRTDNFADSFHFDLHSGTRFLRHRCLFTFNFCSQLDTFTYCTIGPGGLWNIILLSKTSRNIPISCETMGEVTLMMLRYNSINPYQQDITFFSPIGIFGWPFKNSMSPPS